MNPRSVLAIMLVAGLTACGLHQVDHDRQGTALPPTFSESGEGPAPTAWWHTFNEPELARLIDQALRANHDMDIAWSRLRQTQALARQSAVLARPTLDAAVNGTREEFETDGRRGDMQTFSLPLTINWEVDLWDRIGANRRAAEMDTLAARENLVATGLMIASGVTRAFVNARSQDETLALLREQRATNQKLLDIVEARFGYGQTSAVSVFQQREQLAAIEAQIPLAEQRLALSLNQLAVLLGQAPGSETLVSEGGVLPELPALPGTGVPAEVVRNRPDVRAALFTVYAADERVGAAIADRFPSLRLTADVGFRSDSLSNLFSDWFARLVSGLTGPLLDYGRRKAEVARSRAVLDEQLARFEQTTLIAFREVEDALLRERTQADFLQRLDHQLTQARQAYDAAEARYLNGVGDFLSLLTQNQSVLQIERNLVSGRAQLLDHRIDLHQALGGDWQTYGRAAQSSGTEMAADQKGNGHD